MVTKYTKDELKAFVARGVPELKMISTPKNQYPKQFQIIGYCPHLRDKGEVSGVLLRSKSGKLYVAFAGTASFIKMYYRKNMVNGYSSIEPFRKA